MIEKVRYISGNSCDLTKGKVYNVVSFLPLIGFASGILLINDNKEQLWYQYNVITDDHKTDDPSDYFQDITMEYNRNQTINEVLK